MRYIVSPQEWTQFCAADWRVWRLLCVVAGIVDLCGAPAYNAAINQYNKILVGIHGKYDYITAICSIMALVRVILGINRYMTSA